MSNPEVFIPFDGFYESWIDDMIESEIVHEHIEDYRINFEAVARAYVELYEATLEDDLEYHDKEHLMVGFEFKELISPREYNFETDRILCTVSERYRLRRIYHELVGDSEKLNQDIQDKFRSRDGFASFYDDFADGWRDKPLAQWDANELSVLLPYYSVDQFDFDLTLFHEAVHNAIEVMIVD